MYKSINEQIDVFGVYVLFRGRLEPVPVQSIDQYNHYDLDLHHYIKEQQYFRNPEKYKDMQKLILLPKEMHKDLHSAMSDERFEAKWHINKDMLLYRQRKV